MPEGEELQKLMRAYERLGFPDAVGSTDVTHVQWNMAPPSRQCITTARKAFPPSPRKLL
ncbi:unnamed protein product [Discosporangium mesarthrocarpum]